MICGTRQVLELPTTALRPNPMQISWLRLDFDGDGCTFTYCNAQGEKCLPFRLGENVICPFPQDGYYGEVAEQVADVPVFSLFTPADIPGYVSAPAGECPLCAAGETLTGLINSYGFSKL